MKIRIPDSVAVNSPEYWDYRWRDYRDGGVVRIDPGGFEALASVVKDGDTVMDFGCGIGWFLEYLSHVRPACKLYGCDISHVAMVETLKLAPACAWSNDASIYPDGFFDVMFCIHTIEHFENTTKTLEMLKRITKPNGVVVVVIPYLDQPWVEHYKIWGRAEIEELFEPFSCDVSITVREAYTLDTKTGRAYVKRYENGDPFREAICFVKFKN